MQEATAELGLHLSDQQQSRLTAYLALLQRWNRTYNLTAISDPGQMVVQHLLDCLAVIHPLRRESVDAATSLLDVGTGGGLPGVVVAIMQPAWSVTCVDAVGKKAAFVRQVAVELQLTKLTALHARVESLRESTFDFIVSRAFSDLTRFMQVTTHLMKPDAKWMAMKGRIPADEIKVLPGTVELFHVEQLQIPGLGAERCLLWLRQRAAS